MRTYKITNITNLLGKRDRYYNTILNIDYIDGIILKNKKIIGGEVMFLTTQSLSLETHRLRLKKFIDVELATKEEIDKINTPIKSPTPIKNKIKKLSTTKKTKPILSKDKMDEK